MKTINDYLVRGMWILFAYSLFFILVGCKEEEVTNDDADGVVYFLVAEQGQKVHNESFILPLSEPEDIRTAREMIENPDAEMSRIVVAKISYQRGETINKNLTGDGKVWSWKVVEFDNFAFTTIELLDSWPSYVNNNLENWFKETGKEGEYGNIGFWDYTIVEEVDIE